MPHASGIGHERMRHVNMDDEHMALDIDATRVISLTEKPKSQSVLLNGTQQV